MAATRSKETRYKMEMVIAFGKSFAGPFGNDAPAAAAAVVSTFEIEVERAFFSSPSRAQAWNVEPRWALAWQNITRACFEPELFTNKNAKFKLEPAAYLLRAKNWARALEPEPRLIPPLAWNENGSKVNKQTNGLLPNSFKRPSGRSYVLYQLCYQRARVIAQLSVHWPTDLDVMGSDLSGRWAFFLPPHLSFPTFLHKLIIECP